MVRTEEHNIALLKQSAWDQMQKPGEVCKDLGHIQCHLAREDLTHAAGNPAKMEKHERVKG